MQIYVWGILISTFILDVLKNNLGGGHNSKRIPEDVFKNKHHSNDDYDSIPSNSNDVVTQEDIGGMKIKLNGEEELSLQYESNTLNQQKPSYNNFSNNIKENVVIRIQYCTS